MCSCAHDLAADDDDDDLLNQWTSMDSSRILDVKPSHIHEMLLMSVGLNQHLNPKCTLDNGHGTLISMEARKRTKPLFVRG